MHEEYLKVIFAATEKGKKNENRMVEPMKYIDANKLIARMMRKGKDKLRLAAIINEIEIMRNTEGIEIENRDKVADMNENRMGK